MSNSRAKGLNATEYFRAMSRVSMEGASVSDTVSSSVIRYLSRFSTLWDSLWCFG